MPMIDVVQALELFEICLAEMVDEDVASTCDHSGARPRMSLSARALAKGESAELSLTPGASIVFRTADKCGRAGASTARTVDAIYHAAKRYIEVQPRSLQDGLDTLAIGTLLAKKEPSPSLPS
jgi:hypothetical protein